VALDPTPEKVGDGKLGVAAQIVRTSMGKYLNSVEKIHILQLILAQVLLELLSVISGYQHQVLLHIF